MVIKTNRRCDIKNSDRACPVAAVACFDRHVTKSLIKTFNLNKVPLRLIGVCVDSTFALSRTEVLIPLLHYLYRELR